MHNGCSGSSLNGKEIADKVRMMGYDSIPIPDPLKIDCVNCEQSFKMQTMVSKCPDCGMVYAVTPCHAHSAQEVQAAGIEY